MSETPSPSLPASDGPVPSTPDQQALQAAFERILRPLASLALARGLPCAVAEELLRAAFVDAARQARPDPAAHGLVSGISTATGLSRREVTRLLGARRTSIASRRWPAGELFTRWLSDPALKPARGQSRSLPRQGPAPSFEALAQSITRDVHPRSLLDELCRLGLARHDEKNDRVELQRDAFVPKGDFARMLGFLGANVGDHLSAAVDNTTVDTTRHLEQAVFADELSRESLQAVRTLISEHWQAIFARLVPTFEALIAEDRLAGRRQDQRMRVGLYTYSSTMTAPGDGEATGRSTAKADTRRNQKEST